MQRARANEIHPRVKLIRCNYVGIHISFRLASAIIAPAASWSGKCAHTVRSASALRLRNKHKRNNIDLKFCDAHVRTLFIVRQYLFEGVKPLGIAKAARGVSCRTDDYQLADNCRN